jgi:2-polyprenyl-6-methoxyphenol hydroxylase-like FAD-dependent oxidoreductase
MTGLLTGVGAPILYSKTIVSLDQSARGVDVGFSDGTRDTYDLVVGADGTKSTVRKLVFPEIEPSYRSFCAWRTLMDGSERGATLTARITPGLALGSFSAGPNLIYAFILAHYPEPPSLSRDEHLERLKELARSFRGFVPSLIQEQRDPTRVVFVPVNEIDCAPYHRGRVVVIGDAAHAFSPQFAQGAAMAIEDAVALTELLATSADIDLALRSYESKRRPRVNKVRAAVRHRAILLGMEGPGTPELVERYPPVFPSPEAIYDSLVEELL